MSSRRRNDRHAQLDRRDTIEEELGLHTFLSEEGESEIDAPDLTEPWQHFGFGASMAQRKQACSCWQAEPYGRVRPPSSTFRRVEVLLKFGTTRCW